MMNKKKSNEREDFFKKKYQYKITKRRNLKLFIKNITLLNIGKNRVYGNNRRGRGSCNKKKLQLTLVATSEKENCLYHSTYII